VPNPLVAGAILLLAVIAVVTAVLAFRHRLSFRIAMRNVRRGRARTALLIAGLLVGTTIVSGSLVVGDTIQQLSYHYTYLGAGYVDEAISRPSSSFFPDSVFSTVNATLAGDPLIAGVVPEIVASGAAYDKSSDTPETNMNLIGVNASQSAPLGSFVADNGTRIAGPLPGKVLLDQQAATALNASTGDDVVVYGVVGVPLVVQGIVQENVRGAFITAGLSPGNLFVTLPTAQALENVSGEINYIAVTNTGSQAGGAASSSEVAAHLNATLASTLSTYHLKVTTPLQTALQAANHTASDIETLFLALGLFSILAGAMLIVGIFVMLAEERKGEMGMLRAIGMRRRELVYAYFFEGVAYAAASALAGAFVGVGVGYVMIRLTGPILASEGIPSGALLQSFTFTAQSLVLAYLVGFLLTLVTVIVACRRAAGLNIVRAIRDIPEPRPHVRTYTFLAVLGAVLAVLGIVAYLGSYRGTGNLSYPIISGAMVILGVGLVASRFVKNRYAFSAVGLGLLLWSGIEPLHTALFGTAHSSSVFNLFVEGVLLVGGMLMVVLLNADLLVAGLRRALGRRSTSSPVVRIGLDYPARRPSRTAVSLTIFALVVFTMVATAGVGASVQQSLNQSVATESGGYTYYGYSQVALPHLWEQIAANATLAPMFSNAVPLILGPVIDVTVPGYASNPYSDDLISPPVNASGPADFFSTNGFSFQSTLGGMSAAVTFHDLATNASVAVVDEGYANIANSLSVGGGAHPKLGVGTTIQIATAEGAHPTNLTVVGILSESVVSGVWVNPTTAGRLGFTNQSGYLITTAPGVSSATAARDLKRAFFAEGLVLFDFRDLLATSISVTEGFIGLLEVFVGLGLGVGIAAMGIFALRAVVERRREIGMLRATGFTQGMVLRSLFLEYSFVTVLGIAIGVGLGLLVVYNVTLSPSATTEGLQQFATPWATIFEIAAVAYFLVLVAIAAPSLRAARMPPAEAVRASE
jgi:putative ABC transport system permease protein